MTTAWFIADEGVPLLRTVEGDRFSWSGIHTVELPHYDTVMLIGSSALDRSSVLSRDACDKLWAYAQQGGRIYAELVEAFDFPVSRLFNWKQDFPVTRRTIEKLRVEAGIAGLETGELMEWSGSMMRGFTFESEVRLTFGIFKDTHVSRKPAEMTLPGLIVRKLGLGTVVYAAFSLLGCAQPEMLRPHGRWMAVLRSLSEETGIKFPYWKPLIEIERKQDPAYTVEANLSWFLRSGMLPASDGSEGVYENIHSVTGKLSPDRRPDCHAHTALMLHLYGRWKQDERSLEASDRLLGYLFDQGYQDMDPDSPSYGFFKWYDIPGPYPHQLFTDDNAWVCLVLLYLYRKTGKPLYRERGLLLAEALLATQRSDGLRTRLLTREQLGEIGRPGAAQLDACLNPHFESIVHAAFIQAYLVTQNVSYLNHALNGTRQLLGRWDELDFMYSRTSGLTRLLLPLGFLSRHDESGEILSGLRRTADYLVARQTAWGGIEEADNPDPERFGLEDAGVYIANGEGIADQLYTNNFLVMNSWEAWKATGLDSCRKLHSGVAAFMQQIQIRSGDDRYNGGWMRAFDLNKAEYFGNNGDTGWGPYCMESGWTNAITSAGMLLAMLEESLFE